MAHLKKIHRTHKIHTFDAYKRHIHIHFYMQDTHILICKTHTYCYVRHTQVLLCKTQTQKYKTNTYIGIKGTYIRHIHMTHKCIQSPTKTDLRGKCNEGKTFRGAFMLSRTALDLYLLATGLSKETPHTRAKNMPW